MNLNAQIEVHGHRGWRGAYPENSIHGFIKALELGVDVLEMDVVISGDDEVIVSHEPWINPDICQFPKEFKIGKKTNIYKLTLDQIQQFDCGSKGNKRFPFQSKEVALKPTLRQVVNTLTEWQEKHSGRHFGYNIEIKRRPEWDQLYCPAYKIFCDLVLNVILESGIRDQTVIQSFDIDVLEYIHKRVPEIPLALLVDKGELSSNLNLLSFQPAIYSPAFRLIDLEQVTTAKKNGIRIIPWTVNKEKDIHKLIQWHVDGIISDYPEKVLQLLNR